MSPGKPKPPRDEVYGKPVRDNMKKDKIQNNPDRNKKPKPGDQRDRKVIYAAPKQERRPVDERGVVRRGPGGPAVVAPKPGPGRGKLMPRSPRKRKPGDRRA
jgi:hypothetical protein